MNISDIARMAGVSPAAVSRYLNHGYISEEKKERIRQVIEQTGYKPSAQAQMLRTKKSKQIGVIVPKISSEAISQVVDGISSAVAREGYQLLLGNTDNDPDKELEYFQLFLNNQVDGIIFSATVITRKHKTVLQEIGIPVVIVGQYSDQVSCVYHDDYNASKELVKRMIDAGACRIGYIGVTPKDRAAGYNRKRGYLEALTERGLIVDENRMAEGFFSSESGYQNMKRLAERAPEIDGVFCATDRIAIGAMQYLKENGKRIPEDIRIVGIGDNSISHVIAPRLTTAHLYYRASGNEAGEMLLQMLKQENCLDKKIKLGYEIIAGESV